LRRAAYEIISGGNPQGDSTATPMIPNPLALIAEVTHRCPLHCVYCSNPLELAAVSSELSTAEWVDVFRQSGKRGRALRAFTPI
jgi:pyrroloquinoline quinone biosynthesis protein E